jgi:hypothetical protein
VGLSRLGNANVKECFYSPTHGLVFVIQPEYSQCSIVKKGIYVFNYVIIVESVH